MSKFIKDYLKDMKNVFIAGGVVGLSLYCVKLGITAFCLSASAVNDTNKNNK